MNYRNATPNDLVHLSILFDAYRMFYGKTSDVNAAQSFLQERLTQQDSVIYVAEDERGNLGGFVQLYPLFSSVRMRKLWLLNDLFVDAKHRGNGISSGLIDKAKALVRESDAAGMYLETEITNEIGNILYPKMGFKLNDYANFYEWFAD